MISSKKALNIILNKAKRLGTQTLSLDDALGFVLAADVKARINVPVFDNSAMDGFAVHKENLIGEPLKIIGEVQAGQKAAVKVSKGKAVSIMTGAPVPAGTAAIVPVENVHVEGESLIIRKPVLLGANIRKAGEDIKKGSVVIKAGSLLKPIHLGLAASVGESKLKVYNKPALSLVVTGNEIIEPGKKLLQGQIYDSNSYLIKNLLAELSIDICFFAYSADTLAKTKSVLRKALSKADIVITTGGISVGKYDFLSLALENIGAKCHFNKVNQKPGKPLSFFTYKNKIILCLPGNPVAVATCFELYARPLLLKMSGFSQISRPRIKAVLAQPVKKKKGRASFIRVNLAQKNGRYYAKPTGRQGSGVLTSMVADGVAVLPEGSGDLKKGQFVNVVDLGGEYR